MRRVALSIVSLAVLVAPTFAQAFEGVISVKTDTTEPNALNNQKFHVKGTQLAIIGVTGPRSELGAGAELRIIVDWSTMKATVLIPAVGPMAQMAAAMPGMKGLKIVSDIPASTTDTTKRTPLKKLGTSDMIAGFPCDNYEETGTTTPRQMCLTRSLGHFTMPPTGRGAGPGWASAIGSNGFPLKVWTPGGAVDFEATAIQPGSVPSSVFAIPDGFMDMGAMGMGRGRRGGL